MDTLNKETESQLKEMEKSQGDDVLEAVKKIDLDQFRWDNDVDINRCETAEDIKLLENVLTDGLYNSDDISYIVENAAVNISERKSIDNELKYIEEEIAKNREQVEAARKKLESFNIDEFTKDLHDWGKGITMETVSKMSSEEVNQKLLDISKRLQDLGKDKKGLGSIPEISESLKRYNDLLKGTINLKPKDPTQFKDYKFPKPKHVILTKELKERAEQLKMPDYLTDMIQKMDDDREN